MTEVEGGAEVGGAKKGEGEGAVADAATLEEGKGGADAGAKGAVAAVGAASL